MSLHPPSVSRMLACVALAAAGLTAQQVRVAAPVGVLGAVQGQQQPAVDDPGARVEMFENPNLDRYLRRAQSFLERQDYSAAIEVLQDVVEGRTIEVVAAPAETDEPAAGAAPGGEQPSAGGDPEPAPSTGPTRDQGLDARNAVFSHDGRLFRPVRRLCHELLAEMPDVGIEIYRTTHEPAAEEMLVEAMRDGSSPALERVANRYFVTLPAGRAMMLLADRLMHEGRYRGAVQVLRDLLEVYPEQNRRRLGLQDVWCRFKIALCLQLAGEREAANAVVQTLADEHTEQSLRILGQLESIRDLPTSELFARDVLAIERAPLRSAGVVGLDADTEQLIGLWQYRFAEPDPYKDPKPSKNNNGRFWFGEGMSLSAMPFAKRYGPGTWVAFDYDLVDGQPLPRARFLEHYRLRVTDAASGLVLGEGDGEIEPPVARENHPRTRIAAVDQALLRPVEDEARRYVVHGYSGNSTGSDVMLKSTELVAYDRATLQRRWSSHEYLDGEDGMRDVTLLAAPSVFGERLLLPSLRRGSYCLECIDRNTGAPLWHTPLHAGGSEFYKAPGCPVEVRGGVAFVMTNAGCVAAVDAFAGDLRWIRRYERYDDDHKRRRKSSRDVSARARNYSSQFPQAAIDNFAPADLIVHEGLLVLAPVDGSVLLAIDASSGAPVWKLDGHTRYAPYGNLTDIVGANDELLFAMSATHLVCIELDGGMVRWMQRLPKWEGPKYSGRGRGAVLDAVVVVPNLRELLVFDIENQKPMRRLRLPDFGQGREPLHGSCNVVVDGAWIAVGFAGGVEVFSTERALAQLADITEDPVRRSFYLSSAGSDSAAEQVLATAARSTPEGKTRSAVSSRLLALVRQRAQRLARGGELGQALAALDVIADVCDERPVRLKWHLLRVELCKEAGDLRAHEQAQERLYAYMEGRG